MTTRRIGRLMPLMILVVLGFLGVLLLDPQPYRIAVAQDADEYEEELLKGKNLLRQRKYDDALKSFKRANEMREKKSAECYNLMCEAYLSLGAYKNVIDTADKVIEFAGDDKQLILKAYNNK